MTRSDLVQFTIAVLMIVAFGVLTFFIAERELVERDARMNFYRVNSKPRECVCP